MNIWVFVAYWLVLVLVMTLLTLELKRDLMMMQQNSYRPDRYRRWLSTSSDTTSLLRLVANCVFLGSLAVFSRPEVMVSLMGIFAICGIVKLSRARYKKPLVWTPRCRRIYVVASVICVAVLGLVAVVSTGNGCQRVFAVAVFATGLFCVSHIVIILAVKALSPVERHINKTYFDEARSIIVSMPKLKVVGITGSYGKTSTKHYLYDILSESFETLMTPGSYNTTMGVVRTIREQMKPYTEVFLCEMGAKQPGDIKEICDLVDPQIGVITAVGPQHLESFKTIERVRDTKFELIDALPSSGLAVVNDDFSYAAGRNVDNVECIRYAVSNTAAADYIAKDIIYTPQGTTFVITCPDGEELQLRTKLVGECNISNLLAAVIVGLRLGVPREKIAYAVAKIEQVEHRLNVKRTLGGVTIIDDAFNSNPTGSAMALDVLAAFTGGKRIIITPGMIELGDQQEELNREFGRKIAQSVDIAIIVGLYNREAISEGVISGGVESPKTYTVDTFTDAQQLLATIATPGDTVLYENDLPDTFK